ncbi:MAG: hypothetical protein VB949_10280, partial [Pseudomonadales bacterium]
MREGTGDDEKTPYVKIFFATCLDKPAVQIRQRKKWISYDEIMKILGELGFDCELVTLRKGTSP